MLVFALSISRAIRCFRRTFMSCKSKITEIVEFGFCTYEYSVYEINLLKTRNISMLQNLK